MTSPFASSTNKMNERSVFTMGYELIFKPRIRLISALKFRNMSVMNNMWWRHCTYL